MPYTRIDGTVSIVGAAPDGDSVHFTPLRADAWTAANLRVRANAYGGVQLRLDAIDALETHYSPPGSRGGTMLHQPLEFAHAAAERLLALLGFTSVTRGTDERVTASTPGAVRATVLTGGADANGRCLALLFPEGAEVPGHDGDRVFLPPAGLTGATNLALLAEGLAYPTFYSGLYADLRAALTAASTAARRDGLGLWPEDRTTTGVEVDALSTLTDEAVILPKLFRRLAEYLSLASDGSPSSAGLAGFPAFLDAHGDRVLVLPRVEITGFATVVAVDGDTVRLTEPPESLVFLEA